MSAVGQPFTKKFPVSNQSQTSCVGVFCVTHVTSFIGRFKPRNLLTENLFLYIIMSGFGSLGVACWPLVPKFAGSIPAEAVGFLMAKKSSARLPSEGK